MNPLAVLELAAIKAHIHRLRMALYRRNLEKRELCQYCILFGGELYLPKIVGLVGTECDAERGVLGI